MSYIINSPKPAIFIHIPKTAGASVIKSLSKAYKTSTVENSITQDNNFHSTIHHAKEIVDVKDYFVFSIVRNPFDRAASWYFFRQQVLQKGLKQLKKNSPKPLRVVDDMHKVTQELAVMNSGFNNWFDRYVNEPWDYTWFSLSDNQSTWLSEDVKTIIKFESINDIKKLYLFENIELGYANKSKNNGNYRDLFSNKTKKLAQKIYEEDLDMFNYIF